MDDLNFINNYVRNIDGEGYPSVEVELYQPLNGDGKWHAIIYNFSTQRWDNIYSTSGDAGYDPDLKDSWDVIESHYDVGPCPAIPTMLSFDFQGAVENGNDQQNYFRLVKPSDLDPNGPANPHGAACFSDDGSGLGAVYNYSVTTPSSAYIVTDPKPHVSPSPHPKCPDGSNCPK